MLFNRRSVPITWFNISQITVGHNMVDCSASALIHAIPPRKYARTNGNCKNALHLHREFEETLVTNHCYRERHVGRDKLYGDGRLIRHGGLHFTRWIGWTRQKLRYLVKLTEIKFPSYSLAELRRYAIVTKAELCMPASECPRFNINLILQEVTYDTLEV